jgi:DNA-binding Lrp family transcriptional regulator
MKEIDFRVLNQLRRNARQSLASISLKARMPASTVFKVVRRLERKSVVKRYASCPDYARLGFAIRLAMALKADDRDALKEFLMAEPCVNNVVKVSGEHEFFVEALFDGMLGMHEFLERLSALPGVQKRVWHVVEEMKKEEFLPQPVPGLRSGSAARGRC